MSRVNVVIRTLNEGKYLELCLKRITRQSFKDYEIVVVDSGSSDLTIKIAQAWGLKIETLSDYTPGAALNLGLSRSGPECEYGVILSAHCLPIGQDWLAEFVHFMDSHAKLAGAYGGQHPMNYTKYDDRRDLALTVRGQSGERFDGFFHNANSIVRLNTWQQCPFDEEVKHIEDLVWAKAIASLGHPIGYCAEAAVTHFHGLHQHHGQGSFRSTGLSEVLERIGLSTAYRLEDLFEPEDLLIAVVYLDHRDFGTYRFIKSSLQFEARDLVPDFAGLSVAELIQEIGASLFRANRNILAFSLVSDSARVSEKFLAECHAEFLKNFCDAVVPVAEDHGNYWIDRGEELEPIQESLALRTEKARILREKLTCGGTIQVNALQDGSQNFQEKILKPICSPLNV